MKWYPAIRYHLPRFNNFGRKPMKTTHLSILFAIASLVSGQAAAITVDTLDGGVVSAQESTAIVIGDFDRMNPNGRESDGTSPVLSANDGDTINQWVAIDVVALNALSDINATADATSGTFSFPFHRPRPSRTSRRRRPTLDSIRRCSASSWPY